MSRAVVISPGNNALVVDSCLEETHELTNTVTDHPVETGYNVSDHNRPNPDEVTLRCFISNTPLSVAQAQTSIAAGNSPAAQGQQRTVTSDGQTFSTTDTIQNVPIGQVGGRADNAFNQLNQMRLNGDLITVATTLKTYTSTATQGLTIVSLSIPRTRFNFDGLEFTMKLKLIRIVQNRSTQSVLAKQKKKSTRPKQDTGAATSSTVNNDSALFSTVHSDTSIGHYAEKLLNPSLASGG